MADGKLKGVANGRVKDYGGSDDCKGEVQKNERRTHAELIRGESAWEGGECAGRVQECRTQKQKNKHVLEDV